MGIAPFLSADPYILKILVPAYRIFASKLFKNFVSNFFIYAYTFRSRFIVSGSNLCIIFCRMLNCKANTFLHVSFIGLMVTGT